MALPLQKAFFRISVMMRVAESSETGAHGQYPITLVTAYFELGGKPGSSKNRYPGWIRNFLPTVRWPLVIFCDEQSVDMLKEARGDKPAVWHVTCPEEFYACRYLTGRECAKFDAGDVLVTRSLIWHEKYHFLRQALSENPFGSEIFFWCDIATFRYDRSVFRMTFRLFEDIEWPNLEVCRALPKDKVVLVMRECSDGRDIHGAFFGGAIEPSRHWCDIYYRRLEQREQRGVQTQTDEEVMMSCWLRQPDIAYMIWPGYAPYIKLISKRSGYRWYFLNGRRFPWRYLCRRLFSGSA